MKKIITLVFAVSVCGCSALLSSRGLTKESFIAEFTQDCANVKEVIFGRKGIEYSSSTKNRYVFTKADIGEQELKEILKKCGVDPESVSFGIE